MHDLTLDPRGLARWLTSGAPGARAWRAGLRLWREGRHAEAVAALRSALHAAPDLTALRLALARLARHGHVPHHEAEGLLRGAMAEGPARLARRAKAALMEMIWEREGPNAAAAALAADLAAAPGVGPATALRAAALLAAAGDEDGALAALARAPRQAARCGYLGLALLGARRGGPTAPLAARALGVAEHLAHAAALFEARIAPGLGDAALVANGPSLTGAQAGARIDAHAAVIRYTNFPAGPGAEADCGRRLDLWIRPLGFAAVPMRPVGDALVAVTGCDPVHRFSRGLEGFERLIALGATVTTPPADLHGALLRDLGAAPSSGLIGAAWAARRLGRPLRRAQLFGYDLDRNDGSVSRYYAGVVAGGPPSRHNWSAESRLLASLTA